LGELLWWGLASLCAAVAVLQLVGRVWCLVELQRKWRAAPELWGIDWLDVVYRVEWAFGVALTAADFEGWPPDERAGLTAGQLRELVIGKLRAAGAEAPADSWDRVVALLSEALNVRASRIVPGSRLYADLGMVYGLE
jgi:hypothetical protein